MGTIGSYHAGRGDVGVDYEGGALPDWIAAVALTESPGGLALLAALGAPAAATGPRLAVGAHCPTCRRSIVVALHGEREAGDILAALQREGRCLHDAPIAAAAPAAPSRALAGVPALGHRRGRRTCAAG